MRILLAVIEDLFLFARSSLFTLLSTQLDGGYFKTHTRLDPFLLAHPVDTVKKNDSKEQTSELSVFVHGEQYFIGEQDVRMYTDPVVAFDTAILKLPYGEIVHVIKFGGRWAYVRTSALSGWVLKDTLKEQAKEVFPSFAEGGMYEFENLDTQKLRWCIDDLFLGGQAMLPLLDVEYVTYKLFKRGRQAPWTFERPRTAGTWQKKLRGRNGIHMGIAPKTDSVMEYVDGEHGYVCYVEAVFPDESIKVSSVGVTKEGEYHESMMGKDEWKELRPVFIEIT